MMNTTETENRCGLKRKDFQTTINGKNTDLYILRNKQGNEVAVTNYGGAVLAIMVPDRNGNYANVIEGHDSIEHVVNSPEPYLSTLIGRYGNRICKGKFQLHGKEYSLALNNGANSLHGGNKGFNTKVWDALQMNDQSVVMNYVSSYGEEGYSGELKVTVIYTFTDDNEFTIEYMATTNKKTIVNLTHHGFFNLAGIANPSPTVENVLCEINADYYLPIDETSIPTGEVRFVKDTPFDFRTPKAIGQDINADNEQIKNGTGYDHNYVLNKKEEGELSFAARLTEPTSGRTMEVYTTEPGIQLYTGNFLFGFEGAHGATFPKRSAVCLEAQHFPDTPNHPYFPSVVLTPGGQYKQKTIYKFGVAK
ncbi:MAG: galactose mutarotase [Prevotella sp.]|nr:galactose mutarotase [Prevotella sp.]MDD7046642.1 galactose mutarotase [Prevotella sp.]MDY5546876.1 aldose epimerase family protein [Prevotella sp.]